MPGKNSSMRTSTVVLLLGLVVFGSGVLLMDIGGGGFNPSPLMIIVGAVTAITAAMHKLSRPPGGN